MPNAFRMPCSISLSDANGLTTRFGPVDPDDLTAILDLGCCVRDAWNVAELRLEVIADAHVSP
jgi:hypothetical protein